MLFRSPKLQAVASLRCINVLLDQIEPANIAKSCKADFCTAVSHLESQNFMFTDELLDDIKLVKSRFWREVRNFSRSVNMCDNVGNPK